MLTEAGADQLAGSLGAPGGRMVLPFHGYADPWAEGVGRGELLAALHRIFQSAYLYRNGLDLGPQVLMEYGVSSTNELAEAERVAFDLEIQERGAMRAGFQYEQQRGDEYRQRHPGWEEAPLNQGFSWSDFNRPTDGPVPLTRSVFGYDLDRTLEALLSVGLIDTAAFREQSLALDRRGPVPDFLVLETLAFQAAERQTRDARVSWRASFADTLHRIGLWDRSTRDRLRRDSTYLSGYDGHAIFAGMQAGRSMLLRPEDGLDTLLLGFAEQLCAWDSTLCTFSLTLVENQGSYILRVEDATAGRDTLIALGPSDHPPAMSGFALEQMLALPNERLAQANHNQRIYASLSQPHIYGGDSLWIYLFPLDSRQARRLTSYELSRKGYFVYGPEADAWLSPTEVDWLQRVLRETGVLNGLTDTERLAANACLTAGATVGLPGFFACFPEFSGTDYARYRISMPFTMNLVPRDVWLPQEAAAAIERRFPGDLFE